MLSVRGIDDRGKPVRLLLADPGDLPAGSTASGWLFTLRATLRIAMHVRGSRAAAYGSVMILMLAADGAAMYFAGPLAAFLILSSPIASIFLVIAINSCVAMGRVLEDRRDAIKPLWLGAGRCPCCGYPLPETLSGNDPCTICPECSAAWDLERVRSGTIVVRRTHASGDQAVA